MRRLVGTLLVLVLGACGGGADETSSTSTTERVTTTTERVTTTERSTTTTERATTTTADHCSRATERSVTLLDGLLDKEDNGTRSSTAATEVYGDIGLNLGDCSGDTDKGGSVSVLLVYLSDQMAVRPAGTVGLIEAGISILCRQNYPLTADATPICHG